MKSIARCTWCGFLVMVMMLVACSKIESAVAPKVEKYPEAYGAYAWQGGNWVELRAPLSTVGIDVAPEVRFLVHDKRIGLASDGGLKLVREHFLRNLIVQEPGGGEQKVVPKNAWETTGGESISVQVLPVQGQAEMVIIRPRGLLEPGVYGIEVLGQGRESISVGAPHIFREPGRDAHCVDMVREWGWGWIEMGVPDRLVPCAVNLPTTELVPDWVRPDGSPNSTSVALDSEWFGRWRTEDGLKSIEISASSVVVVDNRENGARSDKSFQFALTWTSNSELGDAQFGYSGKSVTQREILKRYEDALRQFQSDPTDFRVSDSPQACRAVFSVPPGTHKTVHGYLGGDCGAWEWVRYGSRILEISKCKYHFIVADYTRADEL